MRTELRFPEEQEVVQAVMPRGSAAFWLGSVYHGLGINTTDVDGASTAHDRLWPAAPLTTPLSPAAVAGSHHPMLRPVPPSG